MNEDGCVVGMAGGPVPVYHALPTLLLMSPYSS